MSRESAIHYEEHSLENIGEELALDVVNDIYRITALAPQATYKLAEYSLCPEVRAGVLIPPALLEMPDVRIWSIEAWSFVHQEIAARGEMDTITLLPQDIDGLKREFWMFEGESASSILDDHMAMKLFEIPESILMGVFVWPIVCALDPKEIQHRWLDGDIPEVGETSGDRGVTFCLVFQRKGKVKSAADTLPQFRILPPSYPGMNLFPISIPFAKALQMLTDERISSMQQFPSRPIRRRQQKRGGEVVPIHRVDIKRIIT